MVNTILILSVLNSLAALLGAYILVRSYRAWRRHDARSMLVLSVAMGLLVLAVVVEGFTYQLLGWELDQAHVVEAVFNLAAFGVFAYSLHAPERATRVPVDEEPAGE